MADTNTRSYTAEDIIGTIKRDEKFSARVELAVDYMTMSPDEFKKVVNEMGANAPTSGINKLYDEQTRGRMDLYLDDTFFDDTNLIAVKRDIAPTSTPLADPKLEQAAVNFNKLLGRYNDSASFRKYNTQFAAGAALARVASGLSPADEVRLLNRAEEINLEFYSPKVGTLRVVTSEGKDGQPQLKGLMLQVPLSCSRYSSHSVTRYRDLMQDRTLRK